MVEPMKKSESEDESEKIKVLKERIKWLIEQNIRRSDEIEGLYLQSEPIMDVEALINHLLEWNQALEYRVIALEKTLIHAQHTNTDDGSRHQNDGGWFD